MLAFQKPEQGSTKQRQADFNNNKKFNNNNDKRNKQNFSKKNVFQKGSHKKQENGFPKQQSNSPAPAAVAAAEHSSSSGITLSQNELQLDSIIGGFSDVTGFQSISHALRPLPKFLIYQSPSLNANDLLDVDQWDVQNQAKMEAMEQSTTDLSSLYEEFQALREHERKVMEEKGLVDNENIRRSLEDAILFKGSCMDMCPVYERIRRTVENDVRKYERDESTNKISKAKAIKAFSRPAAGQPPPLPSDVRPPHILVHTLNYIVDNVIDHLPEAQSFIWDRTRSIRQDFTYQNFMGPEAMDCNEKIVRLHILTLHIMAKTKTEYSQQQELEQMNKALKTLSEMYAEYQSRNIKAPNEAEFRAYYLLSQLRDPELEREIQTLPIEVLQDEKVQLALNIRNLVSTNIVERGFQTSENVLNFFQSFFQLLNQGKIPVLMSYLLEIHLNEIRFYAMKSIRRSIHSKAKPYPLSYLQELLAFNDSNDALEFFEYYGLTVQDIDGVKSIDLISLTHNSHQITDKKPFRQAFSDKLDNNVQSLQKLINTGASNSSLIQFESQIKPKTSSGGQTSLFTAPTTTTAPTLPAFTSSPSAFGQSINTQPSGFNFQFPTQPKVEEINPEREALLKQQELERKEREEQERLRAEKQAEEEKIRRLEQEAKLAEEQRIEKMKRLLKEKQESKRKRKLELVSSIGDIIQQQLIQSVVKQEVSEILGPLVQSKIESKLRKQKILNSFTEGLYEAFINELLYFEKLEIMADIFRKRNLKKSLVHKVVEIAKSSKKKDDLKKRKREELIEASKNFGIPKVVKRKKIKTESLSNTGNKPLIDLSPLSFENLTKNVSNLSFDSYNILLFITSPLISKFLDKKFQLSDNQCMKQINSVNLKVSKINEIHNPSLFQNVNLLVFNLVSSDNVYEQKQVLKELIQGIELNNSFNFEILVIYWDLDDREKLFGTSPRLDIIKELNINQSSNILKISYVKIGSSFETSEIQKKIDSSGQIIKLSAKGEFNSKYSRKEVKGFIKPRVVNKKFGNPIETKSKISSRFQSHIEASPKFKALPKLLSDQNKFGLDDLFQPKATNKVKIDVYSTPRPKSSNLLQTPSFYSDSSTISNLSNVTFDKDKPSPFILKKALNDSDGASVAGAGASAVPSSSSSTSSSVANNIPSHDIPLKRKKFEIKRDDEEEEQDIPQSILELRRLAKSVRERHGKK